MNIQCDVLELISEVDQDPVYSIEMLLYLLQRVLQKARRQVKSITLAILPTGTSRGLKTSCLAHDLFVSLVHSSVVSVYTSLVWFGRKNRKKKKEGPK